MANSCDRDATTCDTIPKIPIAERTSAKRAPPWDIRHVRTVGTKIRTLVPKPIAHHCEPSLPRRVQARERAYSRLALGELTPAHVSPSAESGMRKKQSRLSPEAGG